MGKNKYFFDFDSLDGFIYFINYNKINIGLPFKVKIIEVWFRDDNIYNIYRYDVIQV